MKKEAPVACELGLFTAQERAEHQKRAEQIVLGRVLRIEEEEQGFLLRYPASEDTLVELSRWRRRKAAYDHWQSKLSPEIECHTESQLRLFTARRQK